MLLLPNKTPTPNPESSSPVPGSIGENRNFDYNGGNGPQIGTMLLYFSFLEFSNVGGVKSTDAVVADMYYSEYCQALSILFNPHNPLR